jgi:adenosine deaminase
MPTPAAAPADERWIRSLPKAEVHVHLEGCIPPSVLGAHDAPTAITDLASLLVHLDRSCRAVTTAEQLHAIAYDYGRRNLETGVRYADIIWNPTHWPAWRDRLGAFVDALDAGFRDGEADGHARVGLCVSVKRNQSAAEAIELVEWVSRDRPPRVGALSIDGNEAATGRTGARFAEAFRIAADRGLRRCVHAGESSGPEGVRDAIDHLHAERIDHGVRAVEDPALVRELADRGMFLDVCPTSNVLLGVAASLDSHPIEPLRRAGVRVSLNTDDPLLFGTDVVREYCTCAATFDWSRADVVEVARTSIDAAFCDDDLRAQLHRDLDEAAARPD